MKSTLPRIGVALLFAALSLTGCAPTAETDGPVSTVEQEELSDQLQAIEKTQQKSR